MKFDFKKIYVQRSILRHNLARKRRENIINRFPQAETSCRTGKFRTFLTRREQLMRTKRETLVLGINRFDASGNGAFG